VDSAIRRKAVGDRRHCRWFLPLATAAALLGPRPRPADGQEQLGNFSRPIPVLNTGGHNAPVRALQFTPDGAELLSAGLDKVVHAWSLRDGRPRLARTLRPPIWRGWRGAIYALALSPPTALGGGPQLLAVGGFGVEAQRGNIFLYTYSARDAASTGRVEALLRSGNPADADPAGHTDTVMALAFSPDGGTLASCSLDGTARLWDVARRRTVAILRGHAGAINALAFAPDGLRLATGGADGSVRLWDVARPAAAPVVIPPDPRFQVRGDPLGDAVNALAFGRWLLVGRENGLLIRYDPATRAAAYLRTAPEQGAVEAVALSPDGTRLAVSLVAHRLRDRSGLPRNDCDVEVRSLPDGAIVARAPTASNLVYALAFSPDGRTLAYAGGDDQGIRLKNLADPRAAEEVLRGSGVSIRDVGFRRVGAGLTVGYTHSPTGRPGPPERYRGFDLRARQVTAMDQAELARGLTTLDGWTLRPVDPFTLDLVDPRGRRRPLTLDPRTDRRWWSTTFIPPGPGHAEPTLAVGAEGGISIFRLDTGTRTRLLTGHGGPVYALAPSPDGRWLVSGSSDQTVRLWRLAGCAAVGPLGAAFGPGPDGLPAVTAVEPRGFAQAMDLRPGDVIAEFFVGADRLRAQDAPARADAEPPGRMLQFRVRRGPARAAVDLNSSKHDAPALTLFPGADREWVLWMTDGFYETSKSGDRRFLGWQRNPPADRLDQPADAFPADTFEGTLRQPRVIDRLLDTADVAAALAVLAAPARDPAAAVVDAAPPSTRIVEPARPASGPLAVQAAALPIHALVHAEGAAGIGLLRFRVDGRPARDDLIFAPPRGDVDVRVELNLPPGLHRVSVAAVNDRGRERTEGFDVDYRGSTPRGPRLTVLTLGAGDFPGRPEARIPFAGRDAEDLKSFLAAPGGRERFPGVEAFALAGAEATSRGVLARLDALESALKARQFRPGDSVLLAVESHLLAGGPGAALAVADTGPATPPSPSILAADLSDLLGRLADYGCNVMVLLDVVHESTPGARAGDLDEWVRDLYRRRNVVVFVASNQGPGERLRTARRGAFAQGVLTSFDAAAQARLPIDPDGPVTLDDFQDTVRRQVQALTGRRQFAFCYVPETIPSRVPILDPKIPRPPAAGRHPGR